MKNLAKKLVLFLLKLMAKFRLRRFKGKIIAVTGSVGKTSTKEAIYSVLNTAFKVKRSEKSMNSDFGLLLSILDIESGFSSAAKWGFCLMRGFLHSLRRDYSEILLFEMAVDKPGDMDFLTSVIRPDIAIITNVFHTHLDNGQFKDLQDIFKEKSKLIKALKPFGKAILNLDNPFTANLARGRNKQDTITYGRDNKADFWASRINQSMDGMSFVLNHGEEKYEVKTNVVGGFQVSVIIPAIICGVLLGMTIAEAVLAVERYSCPPGRMTIIPALKGATILDSSYNSSPAALKEALMVLKDLGANKRKIAVLGNMNELGTESEHLHKTIGGFVPFCADILITVGNDAKFIAEAAGEKEMNHTSGGLNKKSIFSFDTSDAAAIFFKEKIKKDDLILVKGSQNKVRLERFIKALMAHPEDAKDLLVRQERIWEGKV